MADEDNIEGRIHADYADPHLPVARLTEYRNLMKAADVTRLYAHGRAKPLELTVDANGLLSHGEYKGYWYDPEERKASSASLNESCFYIAEAEKTETSCSAVHVLSGGWWLLRYEYR